MRKQPQFDWDPANREHIRRHGVTPEEAEQVLTSDPLEIESKEHQGELRTVCLGRTEAGRALLVVYTMRNDKIRIITAYPVSRKKQRLYEPQ